MSRPEKYQTENPTKLDQNYLPSGAADVRYLCIVAVLFLDAYVLYGRYAALVLIVLGLIAFRRADDCRLYKWPYQELMISWNLKFDDGKLWQEGDKKPFWSRFIEQTPPVPFRVDDINGVGVLHNPIRDTDQVVVVGNGSTISSKPVSGQFEAHQMQAEVIKRLAVIGDRGKVGIGWVFRRRPEDLSKWSVIFSEWGNPDVFLDDKEWAAQKSEGDNLRTQNLATLYDDLSDLNLRQGGEVTMAMVLNIPRQEDIKQAAAGKIKLSGNQSLELTVMKIADAAVEGLEVCGVNQPRVLDPDQLRAFMRGSWDVTNSQVWYQHKAGLIGPGTAQGQKPPGYWPQEEIRAVDKNVLLVDGTYHTAYRLRSQPKLTMPNELRGLFATSAQYLTFGLVGEASSSRRQVQLMERMDPIRTTAQDMLTGDHETLDRKAAKEQREARKVQLWRSGFNQSYSMYVLVSAPTRELLEHDRREFERTARLKRIGYRRLKGSKRMWGAVLTASGASVL